ncbi:MAG TPA: mRNA surveillance protein pelota [Candidatus Thermoplasmatota archaeon]|nr:mRNA surveillance protein pelota [Candidatus Thermoplasmatota archaeon]
MRLLKKEVHEGFLHLQVDSLDDLWTLRSLIQLGDRVTADTVRTAESTGDKIREAKMEKRRVRLGVRAESVEWHDFDDHLRVLGPIEAGPQDMGRHHTLIIRPDGMDVQVQARHPLQPWQLRLIDEAVAASKRPHLILLAIDDSEAQFALLKSYGIQMLGSLPSAGQGKRHEGAALAKQQFYAATLESLRLLRSDPGIPLIVVGPGWWREEFLQAVQAKAPQLAAGAVTEGTSQGGRAGIHEAVKRGIVERVSRGHRVGLEAALVEELMERIARGGVAAYGSAEVQQALGTGAVEHLLVTDQVVRTGLAAQALEAAESARARITILSTGHEAGQRLQQMGGWAAFLRFAA